MLVSQFSPNGLTMDEFVQLTAEQHQAAVDYYTARIKALQPATTPAEERELAWAYSLRRMHEVAIIELEDVAHPLAA